MPGATEIRLATWIEVRSLSGPSALFVAQEGSLLGQGELAAIALAQEAGADLILLDERDARRLAAGKGLVPRGCVGVLEGAHRKGLLKDLRAAYSDLLSARHMLIGESSTQAWDVSVLGCYSVQFNATVSPVIACRQ
jgi:predicted nucleic acid-binding protein